MASLCPSRETAGGASTEPSLPFQISVDCPSSKRHTPSPAPSDDKKNNDLGPNCGALESAVGRRKALTSDSSATRSSRIGAVQRLALGFATVATRRRPSDVAATDRYFS